MKLLSKFATLLTLTALSLVGCKGKSHSTSPTTKHMNQGITINITSEPQTLDPRKVRALNDINIIRTLMEGLTRHDKEGTPTLALAEKVVVSEDQKTYTFTLRESQWSNGTPVTSHDFSYAWKKSLSPNFLAPNANLLYVIKNAEEAMKGALPLSLVGIETPDEKTLIVILNHPTPYFLSLISHPVFFPVNSKVDRINSQWAEKETTYVCNGPFCLSEWKHHNQIVVTKNNAYWDAKAVSLPKVKMVMVNENTGSSMFESAQLQWDGSPFSTIPTDSLEALKTTENLQISPVLATQLIRINVERTPFQSKNLRRAFAYAINRQSIVDHIVQGNQIPATGIVPTAMGLTDTPYFTDGDQETAQKLFKQALKERGVSQSRFPEISLIYPSQERNHLVAQALQSQWYKTLGIQVRLEPLEAKVFFSRVSQKDYVLSLGNWFADFQDPINFLNVFKTRNVGTNNTNWENPGYTELLETSSLCTDPDERKAILRRSEELLISDMPIIPIFHFTMLYRQDEHLKDVALTALGHIDFKWAHLEDD